MIAIGAPSSNSSISDDGEVNGCPSRPTHSTAHGRDRHQATPTSRYQGKDREDAAQRRVQFSSNQVPPEPTKASTTDSSSPLREQQQVEEMMLHAMELRFELRGQHADSDDENTTDEGHPTPRGCHPPPISPDYRRSGDFSDERSNGGSTPRATSERPAPVEEEIADVMARKILNDLLRDAAQHPTWRSARTAAAPVDDEISQHDESRISYTSIASTPAASSIAASPDKVHEEGQRKGGASEERSCEAPSLPPSVDLSAITTTPHVGEGRQLRQHFGSFGRYTAEEQAAHDQQTPLRVFQHLRSPPLLSPRTEALQLMEDMYEDAQLVRLAMPAEPARIMGGATTPSTIPRGANVSADRVSPERWYAVDLPEPPSTLRADGLINSRTFLSDAGSSTHAAHLQRGTATGSVAPPSWLLDGLHLLRQSPQPGLTFSMEVEWLVAAEEVHRRQLEGQAAHFFTTFMMELNFCRVVDFLLAQPPPTADDGGAIALTNSAETFTDVRRQQMELRHELDRLRDRLAVLQADGSRSGLPALPEPSSHRGSSQLCLW